MIPLIHCSVGKINFFPGTAFNQRKRMHLTDYNASNDQTKQVLYTRGYIFPRSSLQVPQVYRISFTLKHGLRSKLIAAVGTDVTVEDPNHTVSGEVNDEAENLGQISDIAPPIPAATPTVKGKRPRSARKSEMPSVKDEELIPGASFIGKVRSILPFGAFVDFGAFTDGLVHVSRISEGYVKDVAAALSIGQEVKVKIVEANKESGRISLTMRDGDGDDANRAQQQKESPTGGSNDKPRTGRKNAARSNQKDGQKSTKLVKGQALDGTVKNTTRSGSFVSLPDGEEGFLPVSEESEGFGNIMGNSSLHAGQEVKVRVLRISRGQVTLTMKKEEDVDAINRQLNQGVVHVATNPFELAFRQNKEIAAFLDDRERTQKKASLVIEEKVDGSTLDSDFASEALSDLQIGSDAELVINSSQDAITIPETSTKEELSESEVVEDSIYLGITEDERVGTSEDLVLEENKPSSDALLSASIMSENEEKSIPKTSNFVDTSSIEEEKESNLFDQRFSGNNSKLPTFKAIENGEFSIGLSSVAESVLITNEVEVSTTGNSISDEFKENEDPILSVSHEKEMCKSLTTEGVLEVSTPENFITFEVLATDEGKESNVPENFITLAADEDKESSIPALTSSSTSIMSENGEGSVSKSSSFADTPSTVEDKESNVFNQSVVENKFKLPSTKANENGDVSISVSSVAESVLITDEVEVPTSGNLVSDELKEYEVPDLTVSHEKGSSKSFTIEESATTEVPTFKNSITSEVLATDEDGESNVPENSLASEVLAIDEDKESNIHAISSSLVKQLREETGAGMMDCKKALTETFGDIVKAREFLRKKGLASADKKASRATAEGRIGSYIHDSRIGVLVEVNCETDFVSRGEIFQQLVDDLAMQVAACPQVRYLAPEDVPVEFVNKEREIEMQKEDLLMKPEQIRSKIVDGRISKRLAEFALLEQSYIKNDKVIVKDWLKQVIATVGENIKVKRFVRFNLGEGLVKKSQDFAAEVAAQTAAKSSPSVSKDQSLEKEEAEKPSAAAISVAVVKQLREETGAGMMDCKKALLETGGDLEKAQQYLRKKGLSSADRKSSRLAAEGRISSYIHDSRIGCLIEVNSETDFVGRNEKFIELVDDLAMQVVACPQVEFVSAEDIPESIVSKEKEIEMQREDLQSKPEKMREKIVEGRISKRLGELVLLEQPFIKDDGVLVKDLVKQTVAALGENIKVRRFVRFTLGEVRD